MWILESSDGPVMSMTFRLAPGTIKTIGRGPGVDFELVDSVTTSKGVIIATYEPR